MDESNIVSNPAKIQVLLGSKIYEIVKNWYQAKKCEKRQIDKQTIWQPYKLSNKQTDTMTIRKTDKIRKRVKKTSEKQKGR
jgi:hypothetical protein